MCVLSATSSLVLLELSTPACWRVAGSFCTVRFMLMSCKQDICIGFSGALPRVLLLFDSVGTGTPIHSLSLHLLFALQSREGAVALACQSPVYSSHLTLQFARHFNTTWLGLNGKLLLLLLLLHTNADRSMQNRE